MRFVILVTMREVRTWFRTLFSPSNRVGGKERGRRKKMGKGQQPTFFLSDLVPASPADVEPLLLLGALDGREAVSRGGRGPLRREGGEGGAAARRGAAPRPPRRRRRQGLAGGGGGGGSSSSSSSSSSTDRGPGSGARSRSRRGEDAPRALGPGARARAGPRDRGALGSREAVVVERLGEPCRGDGGADWHVIARTGDCGGAGGGGRGQDDVAGGLVFGLFGGGLAGGGLRSVVLLVVGLRLRPCALLSRGLLDLGLELCLELGLRGFGLDFGLDLRRGGSGSDSGKVGALRLPRGGSGGQLRVQRLRPPRSGQRRRREQARGGRSSSRGRGSPSDRGGRRWGPGSGSQPGRPPERVGPSEASLLPLAGARVRDGGPPRLRDALVGVRDVVGAAGRRVDEGAEGRKRGASRGQSGEGGVFPVGPRPSEGGVGGSVGRGVAREGGLLLFGERFLGRGCDIERDRE